MYHQYVYLNKSCNVIVVLCIWYGFFVIPLPMMHLFYFVIVCNLQWIAKQPKDLAIASIERDCYLIKTEHLGSRRWTEY